MKNSLLEAIGNKLTVSYSHSVQPNILLRTAVFSPCSTNQKPKKIEKDVTDELCRLEFFNKEGYDYIGIAGPELNIRTDFRVWCGVIMAFTKYGYDTDVIKLSLSEFANLCGFRADMLSAKFRERIANSLDKISDIKIKMSAENGKKVAKTRLIFKFKFDADIDQIVIQGDPDLWELYAIDLKILIDLNTLKSMPRSEVAQCLFLYMSSLPQDPIPIKLSRMRRRIDTTSATNDANKSIKAAIKKLEEIGYIKGTWIDFQREKAYLIYEKGSAHRKKIKN